MKYFLVAAAIWFMMAVAAAFMRRPIMVAGFLSVAVFFLFVGYRSRQV